jgi:multicomponent K+:H+ antiporter subunit G
VTLEQLPLWASLPASILLVAGGLFALIGSIGLLRLRDFYARMHPPTMGATLGTGCVLLASVVVSSAWLHRPVFHEILITLFVVLTAPITAMVLMRAARRRPRRLDVVSSTVQTGASLGGIDR